MSKFVALAVDPNVAIHGLLPFTAKAGNGVVIDPTDPASLKLASGTKAFALVRDVVAELTLEESVFSPNLETPYVQNGDGSARRLLQAEYEGTEYLIPSGTGALTTETAVDTALGWNNGRLRVAQGGEEVAAYLRAQLTPLYSDSGTARILVEFA